MRHLRIGIDVDGCLANYNQGFLGLLREVSKLPLKVPDTGWPDRWDWFDLLYQQGLTREHVQQAQARVESTAEWFWGGLRPMDDCWRSAEAIAIARLQGHDLYFITHRPGNSAKAQTESWLTVHLGYSHPTVLVSGKKGFIAGGLELDHMIEDRPENLLDVRRMMGLLCKGWLVDRPWNQGIDERYVTRVNGVAEALQRIMERK